MIMYESMIDDLNYEYQIETIQMITESMILNEGIDFKARFENMKKAFLKIVGIIRNKIQEIFKSIFNKEKVDAKMAEEAVKKAEQSTRTLETMENKEKKEEIKEKIKQDISKSTEAFVNNIPKPDKGSEKTSTSDTNNKTDTSTSNKTDTSNKVEKKGLTILKLSNFSLREYVKLGKNSVNDMKELIKQTKSMKLTTDDYNSGALGTATSYDDKFEKMATRTDFMDNDNKSPFFTRERLNDYNKDTLYTIKAYIKLIDDALPELKSSLSELDELLKELEQVISRLGFENFANKYGNMKEDDIKNDAIKRSYHIYQDQITTLEYCYKQITKHSNEILKLLRKGISSLTWYRKLATRYCTIISSVIG